MKNQLKFLKIIFDGENEVLLKVLFFFIIATKQIRQDGFFLEKAFRKTKYQSGAQIYIELIVYCRWHCYSRWIPPKL